MAQSMWTAVLTACMAIAAGSCQAGQDALNGVYYGFRTDHLNNKVRARETLRAYRLAR